MKRPSPGLLLAACLWLALPPLAAPAAVAQQSRRGNRPRASSRHDDHASHPPAKDSVPRPPGDVKLSLPDVAVVDQDGRQRKFYSDLVKGRLVVINFIYTSCQAVCPMVGRNFTELQNALGERFGRDERRPRQPEARGE